MGKRGQAVANAKKEKKQSAYDILRTVIDGGAKVLKPLFITNAYAAEDFFDAFREAGFDINTVQTIEFEENDVYVFTEEELSALLERAGFYVSTLEPSRTENVTWVWFKKIAALRLRKELITKIGKPNLTALSQCKVETPAVSLPHEYAYVIAAMLQSIIKRPVELTVPHTHRLPYKPDGPFQIYIWSSTPAGERIGIVPEKIWGIRVSVRDASYVPDARKDTHWFKNKEKSVVLSDRGYAVAELFPNALYVHHDLVHYGRPEELELFVELLNRCRPFFLEPDAFEKYLQEAERIRLEQEARAFPLLVERSVEMRATRQKAAIEVAERNVKETKQAYFEAERTLFAEQQVLLNPDVMKERFLFEYTKLRDGGVDFIEGVTFDPQDEEDTVVLHTGEIVVEHPRRGSMHRLGKFDVTLKLATGGVFIFNRTRVLKQPDGREIHSPHIFRDGAVCLGNIEREMTSYIAHYELEAAAVLAVAFLQSVRNDESYLSRLELFPVIDKKVTEVA